MQSNILFSLRKKYPHLKVVPELQSRVITHASFREYPVVHQDRWFIEHYSRQDDGSWLLREYSGDGASVPIDRLGIHLPLAEVYAVVV